MGSDVNALPGRVFYLVFFSIILIFANLPNFCFVFTHAFAILEALLAVELRVSTIESADVLSCLTALPAD